MKKALIMVAAIVLTAAISISGTLAYLTSKDSTVNTFAAGNVKIRLNEDFQQGAQLMPGVDIKKEVSITNTGNTDAWVWFTYATPVAASDPNGDASKNPVHINLAGRYWANSDKDATSGQYYLNSKYWEDGQTEAVDWTDTWHVAPFNNEIVEINGAEYYIQTVLYNGTIVPGETTNIGMNKVYLDAHIDYDSNDDKYYWVDNGTATLVDYDFADYKIYVAAYAIQANDFANVTEAYEAYMGQWGDNGNVEYDEPVFVSTPEELTKALADASAAKAGDSTIYLADDITLTGDWTPISVDGYNGAGIVTVEGQGHTITGLNAPLFDGGFAGESGIVIRDLTIADSEIKSDNTQGAGAFINCVDSMTTITLDNCHLLNSTVDAPNARTGGLIGWTSGYSKQDDGPVKTYVTITDCSVVGCTITGTAVGGINGHAGASDWTYTTIENCTVMNNTLISTDDGDWRVGAVLGTANVGEVTITGTISDGNTMIQENASSQRADGLSDLVGRAVLGTTGKLTVNE